ncbi:MAG: hypothetical protein N3B13_11960, partial [Deltaproteobacteria bacterium]|nr:hypothetical protein [Deltaproteobacteria bacterium]
TLDKEIATVTQTPTPPPSPKKSTEPVREAKSSGMDFGMVNLDEAIASSVSTSSHTPDKPKPSPINISETKKESEKPTSPDTTEKSTSKKFKVKRKSGKIFGPFDEETIVRMLVENKLLGNEEVSEDGINWQAISKIPEFQKAIQSMLENISNAPPAVSKPSEKPIQEVPKPDDKKKIAVKKEGIKEPTKFDEIKEVIGEKTKELKEKFSNLPKKTKYIIISAAVIAAILIIAGTGYSIYLKIFGGKLSGPEQQIVTNSLNRFYSGNYAEISEGLNSLKALYSKVRFKTPICAVISRILIYQRSFLSADKENEDFLSRCIKDIKKEKIDTPDSLFALGLYYAITKDTENLKDIFKSLNSSPHYQSYINAVQNIYAKNYSQSVIDFENYLKGASQDSLTMEI